MWLTYFADLRWHSWTHLWASWGEDIFVTGVKLQRLYRFCLVQRAYLSHVSVTPWLLYQSDPVQPAGISVNTKKETASRGWMEGRGEEVGYKLLIGNSPEEIHWRGCYASLKIAHACESKKPIQLFWDNCSWMVSSSSTSGRCFPPFWAGAHLVLSHHVTVPTRSAAKALWKYFHFHSKFYCAWLSNAQLWFRHERGSPSWYTARLCAIKHCTSEAWKLFILFAE